MQESYIGAQPEFVASCVTVAPIDRHGSLTSQEDSAVRNHHVLIVGMLLAVGLVACGGGGSSPAASSAPAASVGTAGANLGSAMVKISATTQLTFDPAMQTAHVGDVIQWTNTGSVTHTSTFDSEPSLNDPSLDPGGVWEVKFTTAGTYQYHCTIHSAMVGTIVVS